MESNVHRSGSTLKIMGNAYSANFHWTTNFSGSSVLALDWIFPHTLTILFSFAFTFSFLFSRSQPLSLSVALSPFLSNTYSHTHSKRKKTENNKLRMLFFQMRFTYTYSYFEKACLCVSIIHISLFIYGLNCFLGSHIPCEIRWFAKQCHEFQLTKW